MNEENLYRRIFISSESTKLLFTYFWGKKVQLPSKRVWGFTLTVTENLLLWLSWQLSHITPLDRIIIRINEFIICIRYNKIYVYKPSQSLDQRDLNVYHYYIINATPFELVSMCLWFALLYCVIAQWKKDWVIFFLYKN